MKQSLALLALSISGFMTPSCNTVDTQGKSRIIQDSLINILPTWQALKIHVEDNQTEMTVVVGDATFYKAPQDVKNQKADELARMILRIYGPGNYLDEGNLIVTSDVANNSVAPADGIAMPLNFAAIKKESK